MKTIFCMVRNVPPVVYVISIIAFVVVSCVYASRGEVKLGEIALMVFFFMVWTVLSVLMFQPNDGGCGLSRPLDCRVKFTYLGRTYDVVYHLDAGWLHSKPAVRRGVIELVAEKYPMAVIERCEII